MKTWLWIVLIALVVVGGGYWYYAQREAPSGMLANPASVNCEKTLDGALEIVDTPAGQVGYCHLPDNRVCEEWDLYRTGACTPPPATSYQDATYLINGTSTTLVHGVAEVSAAPGSAAMVTTKYFGNEATGDLNGDGTPDVAFILTQDTGGSGTFYYVAAALATTTGYRGTNAVYLGDRIAPQTTEIKDGEIIVNYATRAAGEPMSAAPSVGVSKYLRIANGALVDESAQ
jgi:putative hemolysin